MTSRQCCLVSTVTTNKQAPVDSMISKKKEKEKLHNNGLLILLAREWKLLDVVMKNGSECTTE